MKSNPSWIERFEQEIAMAESARNEGNEGKARVCARRAAGIVIGEYLQRNPESGVSPTSSYSRLQYLKTIPDLSPKVKEVAQHMLARVDEDHKIPYNVDLVSEARWLADVLLIQT
jgi:hypothetical protein